MIVRAWRTSIGLGALLLIAPGAGAVSLGALEVRSAAGAPLDARIPIVDAASGSLHGACFALVPHGALPGASLELRRSAHGARLLVRTVGPASAGMRFAISLACPGSVAAPVEYEVRFPTGAATQAITAAPESHAGAAPLAVVARLAGREGDTLASLARAIFPDRADVRHRYIEAMRAANASLAGHGDDEPIAPGTPVALPDLHAFASTIARRPVRSPLDTAPSRAATRPPTPARHLATIPPPAAVAPAAPRPAEGFRLRLSAPVMDLAPSAGMDSAKRTALRERLLVLDADDRMAQILAMRDSIRRLESQVSALKLKLATLDATSAASPKAAPPVASSPVPTASPQTTPRAAPQPQAPQATAPQPHTPRATAPSEAPARQAQAESAASLQQPQAPTPPATREAAAPSAPPEAAASASPEATASTPREAAASTPPAHHGPVAIPSEPGDEPWYENVPWIAAGIAAVLAAMLLLWRLRRRSEAEEPPYDFEDTGVGEVALDTGSPTLDAPLPEGEAASEEPPHDATTRIPAEDNDDLRRRYIEERFPETVNGALVLDDPRSVVRSARLLYDDGAVARAIELLHFAIEQDAAQVKPWLALFEIFRLERLAGEFAELARRFAQSHGESEEWRRVRAVGRTLDPDNPLYAGVDLGAPDEAGTQGWLRTGGEERHRPLAAELRSRLMADASVSEQDLASDPTPALRKAEIFSVA